MSESAIINQLSALMIGRIPAWSSQDVEQIISPATENAEPVGLVGVELGSGQGSPRTLVLTSYRYVQGSRTQYAQITAPDASATYTVVLGGETVNFDANAAGVTNAGAIYDGLFDALEANATLAAAFDFFKLQNSAGETFLIGWTGATTAVFTSFTATGSATVVGFSEPDSLSVELLCTARRARGDDPPASTHWFGVDDAAAALSVRGKARRIDTAGLARLYVKVSSVVVDPNAGASILPYYYIYIGPSTDEDLPQVS